MSDKPLAPYRQSSSWLPVFLDFMANVTITSKELQYDQAETPKLADMLYEAQWMFLENICHGLDNGIHDFKFLKARQLGISTISLVFDCFYMSVKDRLQGALITDTEPNREKFRILIEQIIEGLPKGLRVGIKTMNRNNMVLANGSVLDFIVAGTRKTNTNLGRSRALNFVHATELSSWGSEDGIASLKASLAQHHPDRLYIWESTAKGFNMFYDMWGEAKTDTIGQKAVFIGWWAKNSYSYAEDSPIFKEYWTGDLDDEEQVMVDEVARRYNYHITPGQIAWHRYMRTNQITDDDQMRQEFPSTEDEAFVMSGKSFFPLRRLSEDLKFLLDMEGAPVKAYRYHVGADFLATTLEQLEDTEHCDLRIWEEPNPNGIYVMGVDPAYGRNDFKDKHAIEVYRCFADKMVQVAEYAADDCETYQVAWVMAHLAGAYKNIWINLEVSGPGFAVMRELTTLRQQMDAGYLRGTAAQMDLLDVFSSTRWYLYHRPDSMGPGYVYNWKTTTDNKLTILNQMRDSYSLRMMLLRSIPLLQEMERVVQDGSEIQAEGRAKDDRVFATALACKTWIDWVRPSLITTNQTYSRVLEEERMAEEQPQATFIGRVVSDFFRRSEIDRQEQEEREIWKDRV